MPLQYQTDVRTAFNGDLIVQNGDIATTKGHDTLAIIQYIQERISQMYTSGIFDPNTYSRPHIFQSSEMAEFPAAYYDLTNPDDLPLEDPVELSSHINIFEQYIGKKNTREVGVDLAANVKAYLADGVTLRADEFDVIPVPISREAIALIIKLLFVGGVQDIFNNTITQGYLFVVFDTADGQLFSVKNHEVAKRLKQQEL